MRLEAAGSGGHHGNGPLVVGVSANRKLRPVPAYDLRTPGREVRGGKHGACDDLRRATR